MTSHHEVAKLSLKSLLSTIYTTYRNNHKIVFPEADIKYSQQFRFQLLRSHLYQSSKVLTKKSLNLKNLRSTIYTRSVRITTIPIS